MKYKGAILTMSDTRSLENDEAGKEIKRLCLLNDIDIVYHNVIKDELDDISDELIKIIDDMQVDLILTTGGTGFSIRDNTPEATKRILDKETPGISEAMRMLSLEKTKKAMLSRGVSGIRKQTLIINLPGSLKGSSECFNYIIEPLKHGLDVLKGDVNRCGDN